MILHLKINRFFVRTLLSFLFLSIPHLSLTVQHCFKSISDKKNIYQICPNSYCHCTYFYKSNYVQLVVLKNTANEIKFIHFVKPYYPDESLLLQPCSQVVVQSHVTASVTIF